MANLDDCPRTRDQSQDLPVGKVRGGEPLEKWALGSQRSRCGQHSLPHLWEQPGEPRPNCPEARRPTPLLIPESLPRTGEGRKVQCPLAAHFCGRSLRAVGHAGGQDRSEVASKSHEQTPQEGCSAGNFLPWAICSCLSGQGRALARAHARTPLPPHQNPRTHTRTPPTKSAPFLEVRPWVR